jgi:indolepyruvate decarboxylase
MEETMRQSAKYLTLLLFVTTSKNSFSMDDVTVPDITVAKYLQIRLQELGLKRIFGVAGNYSAPFLDTILEDNTSNRIKITGISNELCAGYAADGYARIQGDKGIAAIAVTYSVGAFSALNAIAGSFIEQVPVIVINGAPTNKEFANQDSVGLLYSHMMPDVHSNIDVFRKVTVAAERIVNANEAPLQIDTVLAACIIHKQPVYLEVLEDVWRAQCSYPGILKKSFPPSVSVSNVQAAVKASVELIRTYADGDKALPMFWAGVEIQRFGLQEVFESLLINSGLQYNTSLLGKSILSEDNPLFQSVGLPQNASCVIGLGAWTTGKDVKNTNIVGDRDKILVSQGSAFVGGAFYPNVSLKDFMQELQSVLGNENTKTVSITTDYVKCKTQEMSTETDSITTNSNGLLDKSRWASPIYAKETRLCAKGPSNMDEYTNRSNLTLNKQWVMVNKNTDELDYDDFFDILNTHWIKSSIDTTVVLDASFPLIASQEGLHIKTSNGFVAQASWLSIGYAAPAAIGVKCAIDDNKLGEKRIVVVAGDGAFQETCQAVSSYTQLGHNTVVFILDNGIYGIEQKLVNPNPFRENADDYAADKDVYEYNKLCQWNYAELVKVFGSGIGHKVSTHAELQSVIKEILMKPKDSFIIHVKIPKLSIPSSLIQSLDGPGEDELTHPQWPPENVF